MHDFPAYSQSDKPTQPKAEVKLTYRIVSPYGFGEYPRATAVLNELGGEGTAETDIFDLASLLTKQCDGEDGPLSLEDENLFFIRNDEGVLLAVYVRFNGYRRNKFGESYRWIFDAFKIEDTVVSGLTRVFTPLTAP